MLRRKAWDDLLAWKELGESKKALCIIGARQIGKTTLVREFGRRVYEDFAEINFVTEPDAARIFEGNLDARTLITNLTAYLQRRLTRGKTLVLFDEIQDYPNVRTAIKFLVEDGRFDYIESGSLLGVRQHEVSSYPVGFEKIYRMYPMDFREFLWAQGVPEQTLDYLRSCFDREVTLSQSVHETIKKLFYLYLVVGGMPEAVKTYAETSDIGQVIEVQQAILELYRLDIGKYAERSDKPKIRAILDLLPAQLDAKNRRFFVNTLGKNARIEHYGNSFLWLEEAGVALGCYNVSVPQPPLKLNVKLSLFKLYMNDPGLLAAASMSDIQLDLLRGEVEVNLGSVLENAIACQLRANGFDLFYYDSKKLGEVDFVLPDSGGNVRLLEVKSGTDWHKHAALDHVLGVDEWAFGRADVLCESLPQTEERLRYLPWYMAMFLKPPKVQKGTHFRVDVSALKTGGRT